VLLPYGVINDDDLPSLFTHDCTRVVSDTLCRHSRQWHCDTVVEI